MLCRCKKYNKRSKCIENVSNVLKNKKTTYIKRFDPFSGGSRTSRYELDINIENGSWGCNAGRAWYQCNQLAGVRVRVKG